MKENLGKKKYILLPSLYEVGAKKKKKIVGRGPGSGYGKTCGKGMKGQKAQSGGSKNMGGSLTRWRFLKAPVIKRNKRKVKELVFSISVKSLLQKLKEKVILNKEFIFKTFNVPHFYKKIKILGDKSLLKGYYGKNII